MSYVVLDSKTLYLERTEIGDDSVIYPNVSIKNSTIGKKVKIYPNCVIENSIIGDNSVVLSSTIFDSVVGDNVKLGPYCYLRSNTQIGDNARIGDFVEIKNSKIGEGVKCAHLSYIGDAVVGKGSNIGCGTVFCNYDGKIKHKCVVGEYCFIGANVNLVSPISIGNNCFIAAGTTVSEDLRDGSFVKGLRQNQVGVNINPSLLVRKKEDAK